MSREEQMRKAFLEEANDILPELESALLELEEDPDDSDLVNRVFRALHTLKGSGAMFGFEAIADFTHEVETAFDLVRNGEVQVSKKLLDLTLAAKDNVQKMLSGEGVSEEENQNIVQELKTLLPTEGDTEAGSSVAPASKKAVEKGKEQYIYRIRFRPDAQIFSTGTNPLHLLSELQELGEARIVAHTDKMPVLDEMNPENCYVWWDIILTTDQGKNAIRDVFIFVEDESEILIQVVDEGEIEDDLGYKRLGEILVERGDLQPDKLQSVLASQRPIGELLADSGFVSEQEVSSALAEQQEVREKRKVKAAQESASSIRVAASKLDYLVDLVGELVIAQARLSQIVSEKEDQDLNGLAEEIERLSDELRDSALGIRMLPFGSTFSRFRRVVRDLSSELGKEIELITEGAETELDKTVIERLHDPLVHLLRNSIDHGVERPEQREAAGKPRQGTVKLSAMHSGGNVLIMIRDDGKGIDPEGLREKGIERGLISEGQEMSDKELFQLIFAPGFSTAEKITDVSGRGVGMDVVKSNIEALRGSVEIESQPEKGTTVTVKLPLTLAIIDGLQVKVNEEYFVIPLNVVEECVELTKEDRESGNNRNFIHLRGELVPYINLRKWFEIGGDAPDIEQIVVVSTDESRMGLVVDHVIGQYQTVIKSLSKVYRDVQGISGATIRGDGSMALIVDVDQLIQSIERELEEEAA